jgi:fatty-acyl-CoA synthase
VETCSEGTVDTESLHAACVENLARSGAYEFIFVAARRLGNGKADYRWAKARQRSGWRHD